jgi:hypothetical protein
VQCVIHVRYAIVGNLFLFYCWQLLYLTVTVPHGMIWCGMAWDPICCIMSKLLLWLLRVTDLWSAGMIWDDVASDQILVYWAWSVPYWLAHLLLSAMSVSPSLTSQEEDGSLLIEKILGRRPRKTGRKWYIRPEGEYVTSVEQCCFACLSAVS